jgi:hypothetical protein
VALDIQEGAFVSRVGCTSSQDSRSDRATAGRSRRARDPHPGRPCHTTIRVDRSHDIECATTYVTRIGPEALGSDDVT